MTQSMILPRLLPNGGSTREKIVSVLSIGKPLTAKEIFNGLKKEFGFNGSYQAVHKTLVELEKQMVLKKTSEGFVIDSNWVDNLIAFSQSLKNFPIKQKEITEGTVSLTFNSFIEFGVFLINTYYGNHSFNPERKPCVCFWNHTYPVTGIGEAEYNNCLEIFTYAEHYGVARENTVADRFFSECLEKMNKKCATGKDFSSKNDIFVNGDYVLEAFFAPNTAQEMEKIYSETRQTNGKDLQKFFD
ncbi:MAG: hypothetical protein Q7K34_03410, partial [archaeon]|nr:hypothetical protein [archaeon]